MNELKTTYDISVVDNEPGVLARVMGFFWPRL